MKIGRGLAIGLVIGALASVVIAWSGIESSRFSGPFDQMLLVTFAIAVAMIIFNVAANVAYKRGWIPKTSIALRAWTRSELAELTPDDLDAESRPLAPLGIAGSAVRGWKRLRSSAVILEYALGAGVTTFEVVRHLPVTPHPDLIVGVFLRRRREGNTDSQSSNDALGVVRHLNHRYQQTKDVDISPIEGETVTVGHSTGWSCIRCGATVIACRDGDGETCLIAKKSDKTEINDSYTGLFVMQWRSLPNFGSQVHEVNLERV